MPRHDKVLTAEMALSEITITPRAVPRTLNPTSKVTVRFDTDPEQVMYERYLLNRGVYVLPDDPSYPWSEHNPASRGKDYLQRFSEMVEAMPTTPGNIEKAININYQRSPAIREALGKAATQHYPDSQRAKLKQKARDQKAIDRNRIFGSPDILLPKEIDEIKADFLCGSPGRDIAEKIIPGSGATLGPHLDRITTEQLKLLVAKRPLPRATIAAFFTVPRFTESQLASLIDNFEIPNVLPTIRRRYKDINEIRPFCARLAHAVDPIYLTCLVAGPSNSAWEALGDKPTPADLARVLLEPNTFRRAIRTHPDYTTVREHLEKLSEAELWDIFESLAKGRLANGSGRLGSDIITNHLRGVSPESLLRQLDLVQTQRQLASKFNSLPPNDLQELRDLRKKTGINDFIIVYRLFTQRKERATQNEQAAYQWTRYLYGVHSLEKDLSGVLPAPEFARQLEKIKANANKPPPPPAPRNREATATAISVAASHVIPPPPQPKRTENIRRSESESSIIIRRTDSETSDDNPEGSNHAFTSERPRAHGVPEGTPQTWAPNLLSAVQVPSAK
jgi:hypothetical protein